MNLPEDHMDELFRKAGEMYPLKTDGADWDKVMSRLQEVSDESALAPAGARTSQRRWWWLMLLIVPFAWICTHYATHTGTAPSRTAATVAPKPATVSSAPAQTEPAQSAAAVPSPAPQPATAQTAMPPSSAVTRTTASHSFGLRDVLAQTGDAAPGNDAQPQAPDAVAFDAASLAQTPGGPDVTTNHDNTDINKNPDDLTRSAQDPAVKKTAKYTPPAGFYAGIVAGPDLSNVKWQQISNPGYTVGVVLGYRFNRRLSVETGLYWDHKAYYTDGEYFDKKRTSFGSNVDLGAMNGICNMYEIPINLRWDFAYTKSGSFYAVGGLSSYMMKKEAYKYDASAPGYGSWSGSHSYLNSGNNFLSVMNLSLGYSLHWGKVGDVRIEPYFKIPLKGVGIGSLPITSTGIYLGITHHFR